MADFLTSIFYFFVTIYIIVMLLITISFAAPLFIFHYIFGLMVFPILDAFIQANYEDEPITK